MVQVACCPGCESHLALPFDPQPDSAPSDLLQCPICDHRFEPTGPSLVTLPAALRSGLAAVDDQPADELTEGPTDGQPTNDDPADDASIASPRGVEPAANEPPRVATDSETRPTLAELLVQRSTENAAPDPPQREAPSPESTLVEPSEIVGQATIAWQPPSETTSEPSGSPATLDDFESGVGAPLTDPPPPDRLEPPEATPPAADHASLDTPEPIGEPLAKDFQFDFTAKPPAGPNARSLVAPQQDAPLLDARQLGVVATGGLAGLALGYYLLLVLGGPSRDALNLAWLVPDAMLPTSFQTEEPPATEPNKFEPPAIVDRDALASLDNRNDFDAAEGPSAAAGRSGAVQAAFVAPADPAPKTTPPTNRRMPTKLWTCLDGVQPLGVDPLRAALSEAAGAADTLQRFSLLGNEGLQQLGLGYAKLCELAQVVSLLDADSSHPDMMLLRLEAEDVYRKLFRSEHAREDLRRIAARWIAWPGRPHGGVLFSGVPTSPGRMHGDFYVYDFELDGSLITVLAPSQLSLRRFETAQEVGVVGCVIDRPAGRLRGYRGEAERLVWLATSLSLEEADRE